MDGLNRQQLANELEPYYVPLLKTDDILACLQAIKFRLRKDRRNMSVTEILECKRVANILWKTFNREDQKPVHPIKYLPSRRESELR